MTGYIMGIGYFHGLAGIGQTYVIILLETVLCLMKVGQPVFPLEIVQQMRDQRAMMINNSEKNVIYSIILL